MILPYSSGQTRFKTFVTHGIHVIAPYSAGLLVVGIDLKVLKHIEFMGKYLNWPTGGSNKFETFETH